MGWGAGSIPLKRGDGGKAYPAFGEKRPIFDPARFPDQALRHKGAIVEQVEPALSEAAGNSMRGGRGIGSVRIAGG